MKKAAQAMMIWLLVGILAWAPAARSAETVDTPTGSLGIGTAVKFIYAWSEKDSRTLWPGRDNFSTVLVDLNLCGLITDQITYRLELVASYNFERNLGGLAGLSSPNELVGSAVGVRQASIIFDELIPWTRVELGTFIPPLSNYMPRAVHALDLIQYPLLNNGRFMDADLYAVDYRPPMRDFSPWQQAGFNVTVNTPYLVQIDFGVWNGMMPNYLANSNPEIGKAASFALTFEPSSDLSLSAAVWSEEFNPTRAWLATNAGVNYTGPSTVRRNMTLWMLYGSYITDTLEVTADYAQGMIPDGQMVIRNGKAEMHDLPWEAWQVTIGYWFLPQLEILARYEQLDPNTKDSVQIPASRYDQSTWWTIGINYRLLQRAEVSLNYVIKQEDGGKFKEGRPNKDPNVTVFGIPYDPKYSGQENDLLLIQLQLWQ